MVKYVPELKSLILKGVQVIILQMYIFRYFSQLRMYD